MILIIGSSDNKFRTRLLIRRRLPQIKGFFSYRDWTYQSVRVFRLFRQVDLVTLHAQYYLLRFTEGPLRWILWALLGETRPLMMGELLNLIKTRNLSLEPQLRDAIYGDSLRKEIQAELTSVLSNLGNLSGQQRARKDELLRSLSSVEQLDFGSLRNALAHQDFYITTKGKFLLWRVNDKWVSVPQIFLLGYVMKITPPVEHYVKELTDYLIDFYGLERGPTDKPGASNKQI